jgi:hypothetical protein
VRKWAKGLLFLLVLYGSGVLFDFTIPYFVHPTSELGLRMHAGQMSLGDWAGVFGLGVMWAFLFGFFLVLCPLSVYYRYEKLRASRTFRNVLSFVGAIAFGGGMFYFGLVLVISVLLNLNPYSFFPPFTH